MRCGNLLRVKSGKDLLRIRKEKNYWTCYAEHRMAFYQLSNDDVLVLTHSLNGCLQSFIRDCVTRFGITRKEAHEMIREVQRELLKAGLLKRSHLLQTLPRKYGLKK